MIPTRTLVLCLLIIAVIAAAGDCEVRYTVRDIGSPTSQQIAVLASLSEDGRYAAVAAYDSSSPVRRAYRWSQEGGWQGMDGTSPHDSYVPLAVNSLGQVVGQSTSSGSTAGFLWEGNTVSQLSASGDSKGAYDINDNGQIVGIGGNWHACLWQGGQASDLEVLPGDAISYAQAISPGGVVAGISYLSISSQRIFLSIDGRMREAGSFGEEDWIGDVNDSGQIVGQIRDGSQSLHAFLLSNGVMNYLSTPQPTASGAQSINNKGQVVGYADMSAFLWENGVGTDLNTLVDPDLGFRLYFAPAINESGQILCTGFDSTTRAYRMCILTPVPEPSAFIALITGIGALAWRRRKHPSCS